MVGQVDAYLPRRAHPQSVVTGPEHDARRTLVAVDHREVTGLLIATDLDHRAIRIANLLFRTPATRSDRVDQPSAPARTSRSYAGQVSRASRRSAVHRSAVHRSAVHRSAVHRSAVHRSAVHRSAAST